MQSFDFARDRLREIRGLMGVCNVFPDYIAFHPGYAIYSDLRRNNNRVYAFSRSFTITSLVSGRTPRQI